MIQLLKALVDPIVWALALMVIGFILLRKMPKKRRYKLGMYITLIGIIALFLLSFNPVTRLLVYSIDHPYRMSSNQFVSPLDIVVVLIANTNTNPQSSFVPGDLEGIAYACLFKGAKLFQQSGAKKLVLCIDGPGQNTKEGASAIRDLALELGIPENDIFCHLNSGSTVENAAELAKQFSSAEKDRIGLVTSALHMRSSEQAFKIHLRLFFRQVSNQRLYTLYT